MRDLLELFENPNFAVAMTSSLSNLDLVDVDVVDHFSAKAKTYKKEFGIEKKEEEIFFPINFSSIEVPIDRVRIGSCPLNHVYTAGDELVSWSVATSDETPTVGFAIGRGNKIFFSNRTPVLVGDEKIGIDKFSILNKDFVLVISGLQFRLINLGTLATVAEHDLPSDEEKTRKFVACIEQLDAAAQFKFVVATNDGAIYFITVNFGQTIELNHQLVIGSNPSTLGQIISLKKSKNFLGLLSEKSLFILDIFSEKPKILIKISDLRAVPGHSYIAWFDSGLIVRIRHSDFFILQQIGDTIFEQQHCFVRNLGSAEIPLDNLFMAPTGRTGFIASKTVSRSLSIFELEPYHNGWTLKIFSSMQHLLPECIVGQIIADPSGTLYSISVKESCCDIHSVKLSRWSEMVNSLVYSEKFEDAIIVMEAVRRGIVFGSSVEFPTSVIETLIHAGNEEKLDSEFFLKFIYYNKLFDFEISDNLVDKLVNMVTVENTLDPSELSSSLFQRVLTKLSEMKSPLLDSLIVRTIFYSSTKPSPFAFPIDLNNAIRIATVQDLRMSIIMIHIYLLKEFVFPVKYLLSSSCDANELLFYIFSIFNGMVYPFWSGGDSVYDMVAARSELRQYLIEENGMHAILKKFKENFPVKFFLNSLLFEEEVRVERSELSASLTDEEWDMFGIKCAI